MCRRAGHGVYYPPIHKVGRQLSFTSLALSQRAERPPPFKTAAHTGLAFENKAIYFALSRHQFAPCPTCAEKKGDRIEKNIHNKPHTAHLAECARGRTDGQTDAREESLLMATPY